MIGLYNDASGVPGTAIKTWAVTNLPNFGSCCAVVAASDSTGISITGNTQYWIVVKTDKKSSNTFGAWNVERHRPG